LAGNDTFDKPGATALGLLPFVTLPTNKNNGISPEHVEGGLIVPFAINLPNNFGLGLNVGTVFLRDDGSSGYHTEYLTSASCRTRGTTSSARITRWRPSSAAPAATSSCSGQASRTSLQERPARCRRELRRHLGRGPHQPVRGSVDALLANVDIRRCDGFRALTARSCLRTANSPLLAYLRRRLWTSHPPPARRRLTSATAQ
jgi:hypothetical protein